MKHWIIYPFLLLTFFSFGQTVTEEFRETSLEEVFSVLETKYNVKVAYDPALIKDVRISVSLKNLSPEKAIRSILSATQLTYTRVKSNYYSISPSRHQWHITGTIQDADNVGIPYVKLRITNTNKGTYADVDGRYTLNYRSDQPPMVEITALGFRRKIIAADELERSPALQLQRDIVNFPEMTVEYLTQGISTSSDDVSSISIRPQELVAVPGTTEPDVFQLVQNVPGINSASSTVNEIQIRGGTADQNQLLWDGIPVYHPGHFNGMISSVNPNIVHRADLHRGVYDPYFGGKASGLIDLHSVDFVPNRIHATAGVNMLQADAYIVAPIGKKFAVMASGRRSYMDLWKTSPTYKSYAERVYQETAFLTTGSYDHDEEGEVVEQLEVSNDFVYYDINGKLIYTPDSNTLITASGLYTNNELNYVTQLTRTNQEFTSNLSSTNAGGGLHIQRTWNKKWSNDLRVNYAQYDYSFINQLQEVADSFSYFESLEKTNNVLHTDAKLRATYTTNPHHQLSFGYQFLYNNVDYGVVYRNDGDTVTETGTTSGYTNVVHANYEFKKNKWLAKVGMRGSHLTSNNQFYIEPRAYLQFNITKHISAKASFGMQHQFISQVDEFDEAQVGLSNRVWVMADDDDIPTVSSNITDLGITWQKKGWYIEMEGYYKQLSNIVLFSDNPAIHSTGLTRGDAVAQGIDLMIKKRWKNFRSWISYSLADVTYDFPEIHASTFSAPFNQTHTVKWVNTLTWRGLEFTAAFKVASGKRYTSLQSVTMAGTIDPDGEPYEWYEAVYDTPNSRSLPLFHQLDLTVFYSFPSSPEKHWKLKIGASCFNVYNRQNVLSRAYEVDAYLDDDDNPTIETYTIDKYYLGITPNALIRIEFD